MRIKLNGGDLKSLANCLAREGSIYRALIVHASFALCTRPEDIFLNDLKTTAREPFRRRSKQWAIPVRRLPELKQCMQKLQ